MQGSCLVSPTLAGWPVVSSAGSALARGAANSRDIDVAAAAIAVRADMSATVTRSVGAMCRLFGLHAGRSVVTATFWLLDAPDNLAAQSRAIPMAPGWVCSGRRQLSVSGLVRGDTDSERVSR